MFKQFVRCGIPFIVIFLLLYGLYQAAEPYLIHYFSWLASSVCYVAGLFDSGVYCEANVIHYNNQPSLRVIEGCDGVTVFILITAAVLAFPKGLKDKIKGIAILLPILFIINWLRLLTLAGIRFYFPDAFRLFHVYLFQPIMIFATFACFIIWITRDEAQQD
ncbi:MAG: archaeosortase/exosortase family protein [Gammaproteobacteria bacterium]